MSTACLVLVIIISIIIILILFSTEKTTRTPPLPKLGRRKIMKNNCLFDAVFGACGGDIGNIYSEFDPRERPQRLRNDCAKILSDIGLPTIPDGKPAGEQYLQAISKITRSPIWVSKDSTEYTVSYDESYLSNSNPIKITHLGNEMDGHWVTTT